MFADVMLRDVMLCQVTVCYFLLRCPQQAMRLQVIILELDIFTLDNM